MISKNYIKRRWTDFKAGDGGYLRYVLNIVQFTVLVFTLYISQIPLFQGVNLAFFALIFVLCYVPLAVVVGYYHRLKQVPIETELAVERNHIGAYNAFVAMEQAVTFYTKLGVPISDEFYELMNYWKGLAKEWKPNITNTS